MNEEEHSNSEGYKEAWIRFMAPVVPQSATALLKAIDQKLNEGINRLHLMLSSHGGSVFHGISIYNFLKGAPLEIVTYNFGSVDSIGVVIFCAGSKRISVPHARFLIHGVSLQMQGNHSLDEKDLDEKLKGLKIDYRNIARVIGDTVGKSSDELVQVMESRTTFNPEEAKEYGLIHEIRSELFSYGASLVVINEDFTVGQIFQPQPQFSFPIPTQHISTPNVQCSSNPINYDHGTFF